MPGDYLPAFLREGAQKGKLLPNRRLRLTQAVSAPWPIPLQLRFGGFALAAAFAWRAVCLAFGAIAADFPSKVGGKEFCVLSRAGTLAPRAAEKQS